MEGISRYLRLRTATLAAVFVAAAAVLGAMSASANAAAVCVFGFCPKDISVEFINDSQVPLFVQICPRGHATDPGKSLDNPCRVITYSSVIGKGGKRQTYGPFNPMGLIVTPAAKALDRKLYFYVENPLIGPPFMRVQGIGIALRENQEVAGVVNNVLVALQRFSDTDVNGNSAKIMKIVIRQWPR